VRIVIADDNCLAREMLTGMVTQFAPEAEVHTAVDGQDLVEAVQRLRPEVALVDIDMPKLDGLSAIERLAEDEPTTQFIIITAHAEFELAQRGLKLKVFDYLLKPVAADELATALTGSLAAHSAHRTSQEEAFLALAAGLLHTPRHKRGAPPNREIGSTSHGAEPDKQPAGADPLKPRRADNEPEQPYLAAAVFRDTAPGTPERNTIHFSAGPLGAAPRLAAEVANSPTSLLLLVKSPTEASELIRDLERACQTRSLDGTAVSALYGLGQTPEAAVAKIRPALRNPALRLRGRPGRAVRAPSDLGNAQEPANCVAGAVDAVLEAARELDPPRYQAAVEQLRGGHPSWPPGIKPLDVAGFAGIRLGRNLDWTNTDCLYQALREAGAALRARPRDGAASRIKQIQDYLAKDFDKPLTLASVAKQFGLTPNYLSTLFHTQVGERFVVYLAEIRVAHARQVLDQDPDVRIKDLAADCGYTSPRYFSDVFRRLTGLYPSEYAAHARQTTIPS
jgi:two-component system response regulator YesN